MYDSKHRTTDTQNYDSRKNGSGYSSYKREWDLQTHGSNEDTSNHRKYVRIQSSANNRAPSNSQHQRENGEKKSTKDTKKPLRVHGDWSEFRSSTGKTYFYNSKTEVSQWEKPKGWLTDDSNRTSSSSTPSNDRIKKESTTNVSPSVRPRHKIEESSSEKKLFQTPNLKSTSENSNDHQNGNHTDLQTNEQLAATRFPASDDDSSRMSFSSTSSKNSSSVITNTNGCNSTVLHSSFSEPAIPVSTPIDDIQPKIVNGRDNKTSTVQSTIPTSTRTESTSVIEVESITSTVSKAERDQDLQKFYRGELIEHLTGWPSNLLEKQCLKIFDDYYAYSAKMSTAFTELKALKSNFRILEIKRNILTQKRLRCQQHNEES